MKSLIRAWAVLCLGVGIACSSSAPPESVADTTRTDGGAESVADGPRTDSGADVRDASLPDQSPADSAAPPDGASPDTAGVKVCLPDGGRDVAVPPNCGTTDDTDYDGVRDCADGCPYDGLKLAPGVCGCGLPDSDRDEDGIADCLDECPRDPNNAGYGQCGCVGEPGLEPAGTPCTDSACPQSGATCDGAGVCGNRAICAPCPEGHFVFSEAAQTGFWFCGGSLPPAVSPSCAVKSKAGGPPAARMAAQAMCAAKGLTLARIQRTDENTFVAQLITSPAWIGANALQTPGQWYWSSPTSDSETLLWSGGPDGMRADSLFTNWAKGAPASASCAAISPIDGKWTDVDCSRPLAFVCEYLLRF